MDYCRLSSWVREKVPGSPHPVAAALDREADLEKLADASLLLRDLDWHPCLIGCGEQASSVLYALYHCGLDLKRGKIAEVCTWIGMNRAEADRIFFELWIGHEEPGTYAILSEHLSEPIARAIFTLYGPNRFSAIDSEMLQAGISRMGGKIRKEGTPYERYQAECRFIQTFCSGLSEELREPISFQEAAFLLAALKDPACGAASLDPIGTCSVLSCMVQEMYQNLPGYEPLTSGKKTGLAEIERILAALERDCFSSHPAQESGNP